MELTRFRRDAAEPPTRSAWMLFSSRARFHDRPGFPVLSRWSAVDKRILERAKLLAYGCETIVTFYRHTWQPDAFDKSGVPYTQHFVELRRVGADFSNNRFLPSWLGSQQAYREVAMRHSSIFYINKAD